MEQNISLGETAHAAQNEVAHTGYADLASSAIPSSKQTLSLAWSLYKPIWKSFAGLFLLAYAGAIVPLIVGAFIYGFGSAIFRNHLMLFAAIGIPLATAALIAILIWISLCSFAIVNLAIHAEERIKVKNAIRLTWRSLEKLLWTAAIYGAIISLGYILFIIPGIVFSIYYSFSFYVCLTEDKSGYAALKRSKELVRGYVWTFLKRSVFWSYLALAFIIFSIIPILGQIGSIVLNFIYAPVHAIYFYAVYRTITDRKARNEQTDCTTANIKIKTVLWMIIPILGIITVIGFSIDRGIKEKKRAPIHELPKQELRENPGDSAV